MLTLETEVEVSSTPVVTPDDINVPSNSHPFETDVDTIKDSSSLIRETVDKLNVYVIKLKGMILHSSNLIET